jgi:hypothetical protein
MTTHFLDKKPLVTFIFKYRSLGTLCCYILSSRANFHGLKILPANHGIVPLDNPRKRHTPQQDVGRIRKERQGITDIDDEEKAQRIKALEASRLFFLTG